MKQEVLGSIPDKGIYLCVYHEYFWLSYEHLKYISVLVYTYLLIICIVV